ncbi:MAG: sterol carrier protein domain-containing protein, partial [Chloroflexota bacterium]|nr:sterol carrier protein domain-containing protein [Chloroflexota bacterium]
HTWCFWTPNRPISIHCFIRQQSLAGTDLCLDDEPGDTAFTVQFTSQAFTQLAFGYLALDWAVRSAQNDLSADVLAVLAVLFPQGHAWIARSDWF